MNFETIKSNLEQLGYKVLCCKTAKEAADAIDRQTDGKTVGIGGSVTIEQIGLYEKLCTHNKIFWQQRIPEGKTAEEVLKDAQTADVYISSVNALAESGEIINIDGRSNRVSSILFGHKKVYLVVGKNKIAKDYDSALWRARNIAAPLNAKRLNKNTPCAKSADRCYNCKSPERICRSLSVLWTKPTSAEFEIVLIDEDLGY